MDLPVDARKGGATAAQCSGMLAERAARQAPRTAKWLPPRRGQRERRDRERRRGRRRREEAWVAPHNQGSCFGLAGALTPAASHVY